MQNNLYFIEVTDTYGGEANYTWVTRHVIRASSDRGAVNKFSRMSGLSWHKNYECGDFARYDSQSGATCYFLSAYDPELHVELCFNTDER